MIVIRDWAEATALGAALGFLRLLPLDTASWVTGALARLIGPRTRRQRIADRNLRLALPELTATQRRQTLSGMWDNLGRAIGELPHLSRITVGIDSALVELVGLEHLHGLRDDGVGGIVFSAHLASWEILALGITRGGLEARMIYRAENNPVIRSLLLHLRKPAGIYVPKGPVAARNMITGLKTGVHYAMLLDQKMNDGIPVPFFGVNAMTAPAAAQFAVRDGTPLLPARTERLGGARFRVTFYPPFEPTITGDRAADIADTSRRIAELLEEWIRERPEQWLWIHNRWPEEASRYLKPNSDHAESNK